MVDPQKPCVRCGAVDRNNSGQCRPCKKTMKQTYRQSEENLAKIKAYNRKYRQTENGKNANRKHRKSAKGRAKNNHYHRKYRQTENGRAKEKAYNRKYCQSAKGRAKKSELYRKYRHAEGFRKQLIAAKEKFKKRQFEFSLQTQQKALTERQ